VINRCMAAARKGNHRCGAADRQTACGRLGFVLHRRSDIEIQTARVSAENRRNSWAEMRASDGYSRAPCSEVPWTFSTQACRQSGLHVSTNWRLTRREYGRLVDPNGFRDLLGTGFGESVEMIWTRQRTAGHRAGETTGFGTRLLASALAGLDGPVQNRLSRGGAARTIVQIPVDEAT